MKNKTIPLDKQQAASLVSLIEQWSRELGFQAVGISDTRLEDAESHLLAWLQKGMHGSMDYMHKHGSKRSRPADLESGTLSIISVRMDYMPEELQHAAELLQQGDQAYISRYALGRDYHKLMRKRLQNLASRIEQHIGEYGYRVFVDSAPVLEKAIAEKAGLGWIGKHSNLLSRDAGSWFFLGEIYTNLPLPPSRTATTSHCGDCTACIDLCPTQAIVGPYQVDARRCISYLTIENKQAIPLEFRKAMGNRIYGCDDCQLVCPWNRFAHLTSEADFFPRHSLDAIALTEVFLWTEEEFLSNTQGSAIRRIGYESWLRNIAVALGNAPTSHEVIQALSSRRDQASALLAEHIDWALAQHRGG